MKGRLRVCEREMCGSRYYEFSIAKKMQKLRKPHKCVGIKKCRRKVSSNLAPVQKFGQIHDCV